MNAVLSSLAVGAALLGLLLMVVGVELRRDAWRESGVLVVVAAVACLAVLLDGRQRLWMLVVAPAVVVVGEAARLVGHARRRSSKRLVEAAAVRASVIGLVPVVVLVVLCAALVAAMPAARFGEGRFPGGFLPASVVVIAVSVGMVTVLLQRLARRRQAVRRPVLAVGALFLVVVGATAVLAAGSHAEVSLQGGGAAEQTAGGSASTGPTEASEVEDSRTPPDEPPPDAFGRSGAWVALIALTVALAVMVVFGRREQILPPDDLVADPQSREPIADLGRVPTRVETVDRALTLATVEEALEGLRSDTDPRVAVRLAYATVTRGLGRQELTRRPSETEGEYLTRCFAKLGAGRGALGQLTVLFTRARFSDDVIDEAMRAQALDALEQIRLDVEAQPATRTTATPAPGPARRAGGR